MMDYFVTQMKKILYKNMSIGVCVSDAEILSIAGSYYDSTDENYEAKKQNFLVSIHRMLGR